MPSASLQSRIKAFEALAVSQSPSSPPTKSATLSSSPPASRRPRQGANNFLDSPHSPSVNTLQLTAPLPAAISYSGSSSSSPPVCRKTSLIDLRDWVVEDGPFGGPPTLCQAASSSSAPFPNALEPSKVHFRARNASSPLINLESPPKPRPPLPPRKPSSTSADGSPVSRVLSVDSDSSATLRPPGVSGLAIEHTYPPAAHKFGTRIGHAPASSISSFHSISLSSDGINVETQNERNSSPHDQDGRSVADMDSASVTDSFEEILTTSSVGPSVPAQFCWDPVPQATPKPDARVTKAGPPVLHRPSVRSMSAASSSTTATVKARWPPPPPPPPFLPRPRPPSSRTSLTSASASASDRSSILSTTSRTSVSTHNSTVGANFKVSPLHRPTPVPPVTRTRYETLFANAVLGQRQSEKQCLKSLPSLSQPKKTRQAAGWRGLSLDLLTQPEDHSALPENKEGREPQGDNDREDESVSAEDKLNGHIIKYIWKTSRLDRRKLRDIWNECDPRQTGALDRDAFVQGMWRIDEELRRAELARCTSALSAASLQRIPHRPLPRNSSTHRLLS
ncbi:hypothetical protein SCLCIDRAFT_11095 [Scleroderma citrinum Foug A]|uniref:EH domain-containing protein n=1 Tax=Scleroderma citrinum Foug A TaxID=1036808 RepID=A0A0C2YZN1_9AGAM|nr:hypothetical protein SCLCIDRAFT_11095 [Scleroderma citrinum Foug A]